MSVAMEGIAAIGAASLGPFTLTATGWGSPDCGAVVKLEERERVVTGTLKVIKKDHQHC